MWEKKALLEDMQFLRSALLKHPAFVEANPFSIGDVSAAGSEKKLSDFEELYAEKMKSVEDYASFLEAATSLTSFLADGHTNIELPYSSSDLCLGIKCRWSEENDNHLVLTEEFEDVPKGARMLRIEGKSVEELISLLSNVIPHENIFLVKSRMTGYPYQNYHLFSKMNLNRLFGEKTEYHLTFEANGESIEKSVRLSTYHGFPGFVPDDQFLSYEVKDGTAIMHLKLCIFNEAYKRALKDLAMICKEQNIRAFTLDLSENMGGDSSVIEWFLGYTHVKKYRVYEMIDYSEGKSRIITSRETEIENQRQDLLLPEKIFCKVSHDTFSSARTFAVTLKDNKIAKIVGTPTGGKPNSYGMPRKCVMPNTQIRFRVSTCSFRRPDASGDEEIALMPD